MKNTQINNKFKMDNRGIGMVEVILIIIVLVGITIVFKEQLISVISTLFGGVHDFLFSKALKCNAFS